MWTKDMIEVKMLDGSREIWQCERYGLWAVAPQPENGIHTVFHVPTGMSLPSGFFVKENAKRAVEEISMLRNDWDLQNATDISQHEIQTVVDICKRHDGHPFQNIKVGEMEPLNRDIVKKVMD